MHIASCSKLITGIAMTKLLNEQSLSYDTPIIKYLPKYWTNGLNVNKITFRNLMTHTSGFNTGGSSSDCQTMKSIVAAGVNDHGVHKTGDDLSYYRYQNMNFGLCRILIAIINGNIAPDANLTDQTWDFVTIEAYVKFFRDIVTNIYLANIKPS
jgi:CubicO group peptidase (beta-lactamase class C family)